MYASDSAEATAPGTHFAAILTSTSAPTGIGPSSTAWSPTFSPAGPRIHDCPHLPLALSQMAPGRCHAVAVMASTASTSSRVKTPSVTAFHLCCPASARPRHHSIVAAPCCLLSSALHAASAEEPSAAS